MSENRVSPAGRFRDAGFFMLVFIVWLLALLLMTAAVFGKVTDTAKKYLISTAAEVALALPALAFIKMRKIRAKTLFGSADAAQMLSAAFLGMLAVPVSLALGVMWELVVLLTGGDLAGQSIAVPQTPWELALALIATGIAAPLVEEPVFRGFVLHAQAAVFGRRRAVFLTALYFALIHGRFIGLPSILLIGIAITWLAWHSGSVWPAVAAHAAFNATTMLASVLMKRISATVPLPQDFSQSIPAVNQLAAAAAVWVMLALPFAVGGAAVLLAFFRYTPRAERVLPQSGAKLGFSTSWPWLASLFLLFSYLAIDVLRVYGIIHS